LVECPKTRLPIPASGQKVSLPLEPPSTFCPRAIKNSGRNRRLLVQSRTPQKSFVFLLEKIGRAQKTKSQTKLFCGGASVSERRRGGFLCSGIFDKVGSSEVVKILQDCTFVFLTDESVGGTQCRPLVLWGEIKAARRAEARRAVGQDEVRNPLRFCIYFAPKRIFAIVSMYSIAKVVFFNGRLGQFRATWIEYNRGGHLSF